MKQEKILRYVVLILTILLNAFIIFQSCLNGSQSISSASFSVNFFKAIVNFFSPNSINESNISSFTHIIRKLIGHFGLCGLDGIITTWCCYLFINKNETIKVMFISLTIGLLISILTEKIQLFIPGRSGSGVDSLVDYSGYILGYLVTFLIYLINRKHK